MKIRCGFVSNSSSSSFIVAFKKVPTTVKQMQKMLFGDDIGYPSPYAEFHDVKVWPCDKISKIVFDDLKKTKKPATLDEITNCIDNGHHYRHPDYRNLLDDDHELSNEEFNKKWDDYDKKKKTVSKEIAKEFINENKDCKIYLFSYADEDGELGSDMEHGTLFDRLMFIKISNH